ncbi:MAG: D-alanyl-D-alanine carboxypeptidase family protein [Evtepia gabavorous]
MAAIGGWKEIVPVSGWRALEEQQAIWEDSLAENGLPFTQTYVAYPGHSEHQTGLAIDLGRRSASIDFIRPDFPYTGLCQILPPGDGPVRPDPAVPRRERGDHRHRP